MIAKHMKRLTFFQNVFKEQKDNLSHRVLGRMTRYHHRFALTDSYTCAAEEVIFQIPPFVIEELCVSKYRNL